MLTSGLALYDSLVLQDLSQCTQKREARTVLA